MSRRYFSVQGEENLIFDGVGELCTEKLFFRTVSLILRGRKIDFLLRVLRDEDLFAVSSFRLIPPPSEAYSDRTVPSYTPVVDISMLPFSHNHSSLVYFFLLRWKKSEKKVGLVTFRRTFFFF